MKNLKWIKKRAKVKTTYTELLNELRVSPVDVTYYNKKTGWITYLDFVEVG